jgi:heat shock protein HslJ
MRRLTVMVIVAALAMVACGADKASLTDRPWKLTTINGVATEINAGVKFGVDGRVSAQTGCNSGGGSWVLDGSRLTITGMTMTELACDGAKSQVETVFAAVLLSVPTITHLDTSSGGLTLTGAGATLQFATP